MYRDQVNIIIWQYKTSLDTPQKEMTVTANLSLQLQSDVPDATDSKDTKRGIVDFKNQTLRICTIPYKPFFYFNNPNDSYTLRNAIGFVAKVIRNLAKSLNFNAEIYTTKGEIYGSKIPNQTIYSGCVGEVQTKKAAFAAGIFTFTFERNEVIDFTYPINSDPTTIIFHRPQVTRKWWNVFQSIQISTWGLLTGSTIFVALSTTLLCRYSPLSAWNLKLPFSILDEIQFTEHYWTIIGSFLMQGQDFYAYPVSARFILAFWWIFAVIILSVFSADLTSILTLNLGAPYPKTLEELSTYKEIILYLPEGQAATYTIENSEDPVLKQIASRSKRLPDDGCFPMLLDPNLNDIACAVEQSGCSYLLAINCSRYAVLNEIIQPSYNGFIIPKNSRYKDSINQKIRALVDGGIIEKWFQEDINRYQNSFCDKVEESISSIDFNSSLGIFILCLSIYIVGLVMLIIELAFAKSFGNIYFF